MSLSMMMKTLPCGQLPRSPVSADAASAAHRLLGYWTPAAEIALACSVVIMQVVGLTDFALPRHGRRPVESFLARTVGKTRTPEC